MIKTVLFNGFVYTEDAMVLRKTDEQIQIALPYWEDTPVIKLSLVQAMNLRNALDELLDLKLLTQSGGRF